MTSTAVAPPHPVAGERPLALSILDLVPVRAGQSTGDALRASVALARAADRAGFRRYWVAEHHNMPAVAATNPPVLIAILAAATERIRVGSGGVMLPNHAPLVVAEQFALLEAAHPGRIDLGIGRAPGSDPVTSWALRHGGPETADPNRFGEHVRNLLAMLSPGGVGLALSGQTYALRATPQAVGVPQPWLLGSSDFSARLAAELGLPYVFAHHFSGQGTADALALYRDGFRASEWLEEPRTFLTVNVAVGATDADAERLARPYLLSMVALRTGGELRPAVTVEEAAATQLSPEHEELGRQLQTRWVVGTAESAWAQLRDLAGAYGVDEVMIHPVAGGSVGDPADGNPAREQTVVALAAQARLGR